MPRSRSRHPAYQFHISGQARVILGGKDFYLGKHGSDESYARYYALLAAYNANGQTVPEQAVTHQIDAPITVSCVTADFRHRELPRHTGGHHNRFDNLLKLLDAKHGNEPVDQFGPRKLEALRASFIGAGNSRKYANMKTRFIVRIFRHGVSRELVEPDRIVALESLQPLKRGQGKDNAVRSAVDLDTVRRTMPHLSTTMAAMIRIQVATAMRPSELFSMTPHGVDRRGSVWFYRPSKHKTADHGKVKAVPIVGDAREALTPFLLRESDSLCFLTSKGTPWNKDSYRRQITRACEVHGIPHWTPYQIRHATAQAVRDSLGAEAAQALLGHSRLSTTEVYAKASEAKAVAAAKAAPSVG